MPTEDIIDAPNYEKLPLKIRKRFAKRTMVEGALLASIIVITNHIYDHIIKVKAQLQELMAGDISINNGYSPDALQLQQQAYQERIQEAINTQQIVFAVILVLIIVASIHARNRKVIEINTGYEEKGSDGTSLMRYPIACSAITILPSLPFESMSNLRNGMRKKIYQTFESILPDSNIFDIINTLGSDFTPMILIALIYYFSTIAFAGPREDRFQEVSKLEEYERKNLLRFK